MKEIIYLNTDFIHSFMAQTFKGLPLNTTYELLQQDSQLSSDSITKSADHSIQAEINSGKVKVPLIAVSPDGSLSYGYSNGKEFNESISLTQVEAGKEIISKQLHDNALNDFIAHLEEKDELYVVESLDHLNKVYLGNYIKIKSTFSIFDIATITKMIDTKIMKDIFKYGIAMAPQGNNKKSNNKLSPDIENGMKLFDLIIQYLENVLPTNQFIKLNGCVAPLKTEHLRESSSELNFKYGIDSEIEITVIGRATKVFESFSENLFEENSKFNEVLEATNLMIESLINEINFIKKGDVILSPVAIYFE